jgi:hypothetical protein
MRPNGVPSIYVPSPFSSVHNPQPRIGALSKQVFKSTLSIFNL